MLSSYVEKSEKDRRSSTTKTYIFSNPFYGKMCPFFSKVFIPAPFHFRLQPKSSIVYHKGFFSSIEKEELIEICKIRKNYSFCSPGKGMILSGISPPFAHGLSIPFISLGVKPRFVTILVQFHASIRRSAICIICLSVGSGT